MTKLLDRAEAAEALGVSTHDFRQLLRNPTFPEPVKGCADYASEEWLPADIEEFARRLAAAAARGWLVPDALFPFADDFVSEDERAANWEVRRRKLRKTERAVEVARQKRNAEYRKQVAIRNWKNR